jgi:hypothetical protein
MPTAYVLINYDIGTEEKFIGHGKKIGFQMYLLNVYTLIFDPSILKDDL